MSAGVMKADRYSVPWKVVEAPNLPDGHGVWPGSGNTIYVSPGYAQMITIDMAERLTGKRMRLLRE